MILKLSMRIVFQYLLIICSSYSKVVVGQIIFPGGSSGSTFVSGNNNNNKPRPVYQQQGTSSNPYGSFPPKKPPGAGLGSSFAPQKFPQQNGKPDGLPPTSDGCTDFTGSSGVCVPNVLCVEFFEQIAARTSISRESCNLADGTIGVCCPVGSAAAALRPPPRPTEGKVFDVNPSLQGIETRQFSRSDINTAVTSTRDSLQTILEIEKRLKENGDYLPKGTPAFYHQQFFQVSPESHELARLALGGIEATRQIANSFGLGPLEAGFGLQRFTLEGTDLSDFCPPPPKCDRKSLTYRTTDGSCNNLDKPSWGKSNTPMQRLLPPTYHDGIWEPRKLSASGQPLKSARLVSASTIFDADKPDHFFTQFVTQFGQFLDHDITHAGVFKLDPAENTGIMCCRNGQPIVPAPHPSCMPIEIPNQDRFYARYRQKCMEFVRAIPAPRPGCTLGWAEQMNVNSHYLDGSAVYGSHEEEARNLRLFRNGQLQVLNTGSHHLPMLPLADNEGDDCTNKTAGIRCFKAGDDRVNEQIGLTLIHLVWVREHNRVAGELQALNPHWDDERLFQESRRIVVAELQHIVYNEWLPLILGPRYMFNFRLFPQREGFSREYDPSIDPSVTNEFATAAFRFGHTLLQRTYQLFEPGSQTAEQEVILRNVFNNPSIYHAPSTPDNLARGLSLQPMQTFDNCITEEVTNQLFRTTNPFGLDLISLNIQRARDHGLSTYNQVRELCHLGRARNFEDLLQEMSPETIRKLRSVYEHVDDIDLFIGGVSEESVPDAVLGPTFLCIIGDQFTRLKRGDRFFYEFGGHAASFTEDQLEEIRQTSFARILCDNTEVGEMQPLAFVRPSFANNKFPCNSLNIPHVNLEAWISRRF